MIQPPYRVGPLRPRRQGARRLRIALIASIASIAPLGLASCGLIRTRSTDEVERVKVFLISPDHTPGSCRDDRPTAIERALPRRQPALEGALAALLSRRDPFDPGSGLLDALYASPLRLRGVERTAKSVRVHLDGYIELGNACEAERIRQQLERTVLQFNDLDTVEIDISGRPLAELLATTN